MDREGPGGQAKKSSLGIGSWACHFLALTLSLSFSSSELQLPHLQVCEDKPVYVITLGKL